MTAFLQTSEVIIKRSTAKVYVPGNDVARLMYYLNCVCETTDCDNEPGIERFISYQNYAQLSSDEIKTLVTLCRTFCPSRLQNKVFFQNDALCVDYINEFYEIDQVQNQLVVNSSVIIGGRTQQVKKIMAYKQEWLQTYYYGPLSRMTQSVVVKSGRWKKCCCICIALVVVLILIGIIFANVDSIKKHLFPW